MLVRLKNCDMSTNNNNNNTDQNYKRNCSSHNQIDLFYTYMSMFQFVIKESKNLF